VGLSANLKKFKSRGGLFYFPFSIFRNKMKKFISELISTAVNRNPLNGNNVHCNLCSFISDAENKILF
jgi:hypothetical protein